MARYNINDWNQKIDRTNTIIRLGRNGIYYEYIMPLNADPYDFYNSAIDVRSHKSPTSKWPNGKKPGQYQPIGDKRYFNYYQLKKMKKMGDYESFSERSLEKQDEYLIKKVENTIVEMVNNG